MDPDDTHESITVNNTLAAQRNPKPSRAERERNDSQVSGWCLDCDHHLFILSNEWKLLNQHYVAHARGDAVTATLEESLYQGTDEFDGSKNLDGCKITYLRCANCHERVGLHCLRGGSENGFQGLAFLKLKKVALKKNRDTAIMPFKILGDLQPAVDDVAGNAGEGDQDGGAGHGAEIAAGGGAADGDVSGFEGEREIEAGYGELSAPTVAQITSKGMNPSGPGVSDVSLRQKNTENTAPDTPDAGADGLACKTCQKRHMACDRQRPSCSTCKNMGRQCWWDSAATLRQITDPTGPKPVVEGLSPMTQMTPLSQLIEENPLWASRSFFTAASSLASQTEPTEPIAPQSIGLRPPASAQATAPDPTAVMVSRAALSRESSSGTTSGKSARAGQLSEVSCGSCRMRHKKCDRGLPVCRNCKTARHKCNYKLKKQASSEHKNAIDMLDPNDDWKPATAMPPPYLEDDDYDEDGDLHIQTIPARSPGSADASEYDNHTVQGLSEQLEKQRLMLQKQQSEIAILLAAVRQFDGIYKYMETMEERLSGIEGILKTTAQFNNSGPSHSVGLMPYVSDTRSDLKSVIESSKEKLTRPSAPARRGGHSINYGIGRGTSSVVPNKRSFEESENGATHGPINTSLPQHSNAMDVDNAVLAPETASKGPKTMSGVPAMPVSSDATSRGSNSRISPPETQELEEAEIQKYLRETVRDEDSEDDDYVPGNDSIEPDTAMAPETQDVRASVERLLSPAASSRGSAKRERTGRPRGRPPGRPSLRARSSFGTFVPFVPSTPVSPASPVRGGSVKRRGISGRGPAVAAELSHNAFSPSQAATMINDPTPKRAKLDMKPAYDSTPVSFAISPSSIEIGKQNRHPKERPRDSEGFVLTANGTRDKRTLRYKLSAQRATPDNVPSSAKAPAVNGAVGSAAPTAPMTSGFSPVDRQLSGSQAFSSPPDIRRLAAKADSERVAQAIAKGQDKQYSAQHNQIMSKMKLV